MFEVRCILWMCRRWFRCRKLAAFGNLSKLEGIGTVLGISNQAPPFFVQGWCCWRQQELFEILYFWEWHVFFGSDTKSIQQYKTRNDVIISYPKSQEFSYEEFILRMMLLTVDLDLFSWWRFTDCTMVNHHQTHHFVTILLLSKFQVDGVTSLRMIPPQEN